MFRCEQCGKSTKAGEKQHKKTTKSRLKRYDCGSVGQEIVKEISICKACNEHQQAKS